MKTAKMVMLSLIVLLGLAACRTKPDVVEMEVEGPVEVVKDRYELIIYSNSLSEGRGEVFDELVAEADFDFKVAWVQMGGGDMRDRLIAEKANAIADVVLGGSFIELGALMENDVLASFTPEWADLIDPGYIGPDNKYTGFELDTVHFIYRSDLVGGDGQPPVPTSWEEIATNPEWAGKYWAWGTGGTTGTVIVSSVITDFQDPDGTLDISDEGWSFVENFYANAGVSNDWSAEITSGDLLGGTIWGGGYINLLNQGLDVDVMVPEKGTPHFTANISLVQTNNPETMELAKDFINWWGSEDVQLKWLAASGKESVFPNVNALLDPSIQELSKKVAKIQPLDWAWIYEHVNVWREKIALDYLPQ